MNGVRLLNYASFAAVALVQVVTGYIVRDISRVCILLLDRSHFWDVCPWLIRLLVPYTASTAIPYVGMALAASYLALLGFLEKGGDRRKTYLPFCVTVILVLIWAQLLFAFLSIYLPVETLGTRGHA